MKLGKLAPQFNDSDLLFKNIMRAVPVPPSYDWDVATPGFPADLRMFLNDQLGDCVMAGRAHQTMRFEFKEKGAVPNITDDEVETEYMRETGGVDSGLVVSRSLQQWRRRGWTAGGKLYKIKSYARLDLYNRSQLMAAMYADLGMGIGFSVPQSAMDQFNAGLPWDVVQDDGGSLGGHYVFCVGYDADGITCMTWGQRQKMTWPFFDKYCDEAWAIIDAQDGKGLINLAMVDDFLKSL